MNGRPGRSTLAIHGPPKRLENLAPVVTPIYQSSTFVNPVGSDNPEDLLYTRYGNNPNQVELARRYAALEGAERAVFLASGMAATALAHLAVLAPGDHLLASRWIYGGTRKLFDEEFGRHGISVSYIDPEQPRMWRKSLRPETRAIFVEAVTNPLMRVIDVPAIAKVAHDRGLALLVDGTFASPILFRPLEHGADVVITSASKYLGGHSDLIAGAVAGSEAVVDEVIRLMKNWGPSIDPFAAWLTERGMKTLALRVERATANAREVAEWAEGQDGIEAVFWPGLDSHPDHELASSLLDDFGAMVGLQLVGGDSAAERFCGRVRIPVHASSLAGVESMICEPRLTSHKDLSPAELREMGIPEGFVRLSVGCEDAADIIADLQAALG